MCLHTNVHIHVYMINQSTGLINTLQYKLAGLYYLKSFNPRHLLCVLRTGECPSNSPFLKNNGAEAPKGLSPIVFKEWRDTRTFSNLKSTHCTLLI
jgi:hypothetical protein